MTKRNANRRETGGASGNDVGRMVNVTEKRANRRETGGVSGSDVGRIVNVTEKRVNRRETGSRYEEAAAAFLKEQGYEILERNYRDRRGEIDIIARDGRYFVFVEVKYRKSTHHGYPEEAVHTGKQEKIRRTAAYYLYTHRLGEETPCRFDVVSVMGQEVMLFRDAF